MTPHPFASLRIMVCSAAVLGTSLSTAAAQSRPPPPAQPTGVINPAPAGAPAVPAGFVVVQTTYLEQMMAAQKSSLEGVAATSQAAINAAKDKEAWMVTLVQTVGIIFSAITFVLTYFGISKYTEVRGWLKEIKASNKKAREASAKITAKIEKADQEANAFTEKLNEIEKLFTGIHSQKLVIYALRTSEQKSKEAHAVLEETRALYLIAEKHKNERVQSYLAASLSLICMYAELWDEACRYGKISMACNPRNWDDRAYNVACVHARKFEHQHIIADKEEAIRLVRQFFERNGMEKVAKADITQSLEDRDLQSIKADIEALAPEYDRLRR